MNALSDLYKLSLEETMKSLGLATHVISKIQYGADAFFLFKNDKDQEAISCTYYGDFALQKLPKTLKEAQDITMVF